MKLIHTLLFLIRANRLADDLNMTRTLMESFRRSTYKTVVVYNQGYFSNDELRQYLSEFELDIHVIGEGVNVGIPAGRQSCFNYIWDNFPDTDYISEIHLDMYLSSNWEDPLVAYLDTHDEPMVCCGIIDRYGNMTIMEKYHALPDSFDKYEDFLKSIREDTVLQGLTHPCIHSAKILKEVGGYNTDFLKGKQCFDDDSLMLSYYYYYGTKAKWHPKINFNSIAYHAVAEQRNSLGESVMINYNGLVKQYGAMGLKHLCEIHKSQWHKNYFGDNYKLLAGIT
jgi:hypothetical protein